MRWLHSAAKQACAIPHKFSMLDKRASDCCRAILNIGNVETAIHTRFPDAHLQTVYAEDMNFKQQALAAASASILILIHGASLANFLFLPKVGNRLSLVGCMGRKSTFGILLGIRPPVQVETGCSCCDEW